MEVIQHFTGEYSFLSNFYEAPITYDGITYQSSEAAFQAQKCASRDQRKEFADLSPMQAKKKGRWVELRYDWEFIKRNEMAAIVLAKFQQYPNLREKLINTGSAYLIEGNTWRDDTWGMVFDEFGNLSGENCLGQILMEVREFFTKGAKYDETNKYVRKSMFKPCFESRL